MDILTAQMANLAPQGEPNTRSTGDAGISLDDLGLGERL
jgi:hypothetical protein